MLDKARASGMFFFVDTDLKIDKPQTTVEVDRDMLATLGLTQQDVGAALTAALGGGYVNYFSIAGRSYKVIPQVLQVDRLNPSQVLDYYIAHAGRRAAAGLARWRTQKYRDRSRGHQPLPAAQFGRRSSGVYAPSVSQKQVLDFMKQTRSPRSRRAATRSTTRARRASSSRNRAASSRRCSSRSSSSSSALPAQYESFRDPIVILVSVPMALFGALIFINLGLRHAQHLHAGRAW